MKKLKCFAVVVALFAAFVGYGRAYACLGPAEFYSVVHPQMLQMLGSLKDFKLTVGDVLAMKKSMEVIEGEKLLTCLSEVNGEMYYLVAKPGELRIRFVNSPQEPISLKVVKPLLYRGGGCQDHRH